jgi:flagella basal body P-ring formation protein FlgA
MFRSLLIILTLFIAAPVHGLVIEFKDSANVDDASVTLGDIAVFDEDTELTRSLASQNIAQAPSPGQSIQLQTRSIQKYFDSNLNINAEIYWSGAETTNVVRNAVQISPAQILNIIDTFLDQNKHELPQAEIRFIPTSQPLPFIIPAGELRWEVIPSDPAIVGSSRFSIIFRVDGRVRKNMSVRGHLEVLTRVVVAASEIRKGTVLTSQHLATAVQDISNLQEPCLNAQEILGKKVTRSFKAGNVIFLSQVDFPPMVRKGELVRMLVSKGSLRISATGVARSDGKHNETIQVQNINSNKTVYCRVSRPGIVEVAL